MTVDRNKSHSFEHAKRFFFALENRKDKTANCLGIQNHSRFNLVTSNEDSSFFFKFYTIVRIILK